MPDVDVAICFYELTSQCSNFPVGPVSFSANGIQEETGHELWGLPFLFPIWLPHCQEQREGRE
jgi:hypothetical protein